MVIIDRNGLRSVRPFVPAAPAHCIFEHVYFARPDSRVFGRDVHQTRLALGRQLAREAPADADVVVAVPDSGTVAAIGYSQESGLPIELGLIRNHYVGRTFIEPRQAIRHFGVKVKLNPVRSVIEGRRIVLIDDSIVRGTTSRKIVGMVRQAGAKEIHLRISSPPTTGPCYYGIDTPKREELIASHQTIVEITRFVGADSLGYLSQEGLLSAVEEDRPRYCTACFSGSYPVPLPEEGRDQLKLFEKVRE
jgi:amidophosphoribosyltransferase